MNRARRFYSEKLGLEPSEERPGVLLYHGGSGTFALFESAGGADGSFTQMGWEVDDIQATVAELKRRGLVFEEVDEALSKLPDKQRAATVWTSPARSAGGRPRRS